MLKMGVDREHLAGRHEGAQLGVLDRGQERHALEAVDRHHQPAWVCAMASISSTPGISG